MFAAISPVHDVMAQVVAQVAALAPPAQVGKPVVVFVTIYVGGGKNHLAAGLRVWLVVLCPALGVCGRALKPVFCSSSKKTTRLAFNISGIFSAYRCGLRRAMDS